MLLVTVVTNAQQRREHQGPRGIAVVQFQRADAKGNPAGPAKLTPVTIYYKGVYNDASIYEATPVPMAVEAGNVYEVQRSGLGIGLFTISDPKQQEHNWFALGEWKLNPPENASAAPSKNNGSSGDDRPILKRPGSSAGTSTSPNSNDDDERPVLKRPNSSDSQTAAAAVTQVPTTSSAPTTQPTPEDPNRPVLRRGKPAAQPQAEPSSSPAAPSSKPTLASTPPLSSAVAQEQQQAVPTLYVAVSDAEPSDDRSYEYPWTPKERVKLTAELAKLALADSQAYEKQHALPTISTWEQVNVRAFDLFTDNDGELVLTGSQDVSGPRARKVFATLVALYDASGTLQKLFSDVTDSEHLDVKGRLELVDAVDSTGSGRADLLFQRVGISSTRYELYRVTRDQLWKLFESSNQ